MIVIRKYSVKMKRFIHSLKDKTWLYVSFYMFLIMLLILSNYHLYKSKKNEPIPLFIVYRKTDSISNKSLLQHQKIVSQYLQYRNENWNLSILGSQMFNFKKVYQAKRNKTFLVLIWTWARWLQKCHKLPKNKTYRDSVLRHCPVKNCKFTHIERKINKADAVIFNLNSEDFPTAERRRNQRWVFYSDDPEDHELIETFRREELHHLFNWSMTYRPDSDIPIPFGRVIPHVRPIFDHADVSKIPKIEDDHYLFNLIPNWSMKRGNELVAFNAINCKDRYVLDFLRLMNKITPVHNYGNCATKGNKDAKKCLNRDSECKELNKYLFYISADYSTCDNYFNEKIYNHAYSKGAVPVIIGAKEKSCNLSLPPKSYVLVKNLHHPKKLAKTLSKIVRSNRLMLSYHTWRNHFRIVNQHGGFGSQYYDCCKICEALNYNSEEEKSYSYQDVINFFDSRCTPQGY